MVLRVVGAGLGRTGTLSLKLALERLLGRPCYHMVEVVGHPEHVPIWHGAVRGDTPDWVELFDGYAAAVDWPVAAFWPQISAAFPDALVLLSVREDAATWWRSASRTIFEAMSRPPPDDPAFSALYGMITDMFTHGFASGWRDEAAATAAYEAHNAAVRAAVPPGRLLEWRPGDGWPPLCAALGVPEPGEPFPRVNSTAETRAMFGLDAPEDRS